MGSAGGDTDQKGTGGGLKGTGGDAKRTGGEFDMKRTLALAADGDPDAWRALVEHYGPRVFGLIVRQCGNRDLAEEITQDTFVKVVSQIGRPGRYEEQGKFEPWLFRIAVNRLRDEMRRRRRHAVPHDFSPGGLADAQGALERNSASGANEAADPLELASRAEQVTQLRQAIGEMSEADQRILHLRHTAGLSFPQIAETLGEPLGTVLARGHRALGKLRKMMTAPARRDNR